MTRPVGGDGAAEGEYPDYRVGRKPAPETGVSGRRFVIFGCIGVVLVWGVLYLAFQAWKSHYEELATFGRTEVAASIEPFAKVMPEGVEPRLWQQAVDDTHTMLIGLTSAGVMDKPTMVSLRDDIRGRTARLTSSNALAELGKIWDDMETRAGPVISSIVTPVNPNSRHAKRIPRPARPAILPVKPEEKQAGAEKG